MTLFDLATPAQRNLCAVLAAHARVTPDATFLMTERETATFGETYHVVERIAAGLAGLGAKRGDRVAIVMGADADYVRLVLAVNRIGAVWVPINPDYKGTWLAEAISDSLPALLVIDEAIVPRLRDVIDGVPPCLIIVRGETCALPQPTISFADLVHNNNPSPQVIDIAPGDTAAILWTSGTTGRPKGVMQSHNAWINAAINGNRNLETRAGDVTYSCLPLYNSAAWAASIFRALVAGLPVAIDPHFSVSEFWQRIRRYGATQTMSLGAMHMFLWNAPRKPDDHDNPLRIATLTPLPEHLITPFCERFGLEKIIQGYGQSEVMTVLAQCSRPGQSMKANCLGATNPDFDLRLLDDDGNEVAAGVAGEFAVRPHAPFLIFNGYFNQPEATAAAFTGEWYRTGDLGMRDADGDYFFVDRKKDYIRFKGRSVSSFQVEQVASRHPHVAACAAYGIPSAELVSEDEIKLDVVPRPGTLIDPADLARFINDNAPYFIVPRYIESVAALPYTPTNKVEKYKLRARGVGIDAWDRLAAKFELVR
jgi:crotonobetaine/carnitine-CoA ligase